MGRIKTKTYGSPRLKQIQSCLKAFSIAVITVSGNLNQEKIKFADTEKNSMAKFKEIQRKYGFHMCLLVLPEIIKKMKERPKITMQFPKGKRNVGLLYEHLETFYNKLKGE